MLDPLRDQLLHRLEILRLLAFHQPTEDGLAVLDPEALIVREPRVHLGRDATQVFFHMGHEGTALHRKVDSLTIVGDDSLILLPGDELTPIVGEPLAPFNAKVARPKLPNDLGRRGRPRSASD